MPWLFVDRLGGASCEIEMTRWWGKTSDEEGTVWAQEMAGSTGCPESFQGQSVTVVELHDRCITIDM